MSEIRTGSGEAPHEEGKPLRHGETLPSPKDPETTPALERETQPALEPDEPTHEPERVRACVCGDCFDKKISKHFDVKHPDTIEELTMGTKCEAHSDRAGRGATRVVYLPKGWQEAHFERFPKEQPPPLAELGAHRGALGPVTTIAAHLLASWTSGEETPLHEEELVARAVHGARLLLGATKGQ